jgi:hypothetical protein
MHRVHHSVIRQETDSNFGFNLPWWDRLMGTYRAQPAAGHQGMTIGLHSFRERRFLWLPWMLIQPVGELIAGFTRAVWAEERDIADPDTMGAITKAAGLDADALMKAAEDPAIAAEREANTEEGIRRGVFGAPTWIIGEEVFWGQDRLEFVERVLKGGSYSPRPSTQMGSVMPILACGSSRVTRS